MNAISLNENLTKRDNVEDDQEQHNIRTSEQFH